MTWIASADYLDGRLQSTPEQKPGRKPDMSEMAAAAMRAAMSDIQRWCKLRVILYESGLGIDDNPALTKFSPEARLEAAHKIITNHERVLADLTNQGHVNIDGKPLTQAFTMKRLREQDTIHLDGFLYEVARRLLGSHVGTDVIVPIPTDPDAARAWVDANKYLELRIQSTPQQKPGREPDMGVEAAAAMISTMRQLTKEAGETKQQASQVVTQGVRMPPSAPSRAPPQQYTARSAPTPPPERVAARIVKESSSHSVGDELVSPVLLRRNGSPAKSRPPQRQPQEPPKPSPAPRSQPPTPQQPTTTPPMPQPPTPQPPTPQQAVPPSPKGCLTGTVRRRWP